MWLVSTTISVTLCTLMKVFGRNVCLYQCLVSNAWEHSRVVKNLPAPSSQECGTSVGQVNYTFVPQCVHDFLHRVLEFLGGRSDASKGQTFRSQGCWYMMPTRHFYMICLLRRNFPGWLISFSKKKKKLLLVPPNLFGLILLVIIAGLGCCCII